LARVREEIDDDQGEIKVRESGFGLENVNKRVKLYYGQQYGMSIYSEHGVGTRVTVIIPAKNGSTKNN